MTEEAQSYKHGTLRELLIDAFDTDELRDLVLHDEKLGGLAREFAPVHSITVMADTTIGWCDRRGLVPYLVQRIREERPEKYRLYEADLLGSAIPHPPPDPEELPEPGDLPLGSRIPFGRNALFTGRVEPLLSLARALLYDGTSAAVVTQVVQGMGGIGKTQLAVEFAYRYGRCFQGVHWIAATQPDGIGAEIAACGGRMALLPWPQEQPEQVERTLQAWHSAGPRLVILDNLEDLEAARQWLPRLHGGGVRLMLTARRSDWPGYLGLYPLRLDLFSPDESLAFFHQTLPSERASDGGLASLAERLGHLPLALELAARYLLRLPRLTVPGYLGKLDDLFSDPAMVGWRADLGNPTGHDLDLAATFRLSWEEVADEDARTLFLIAGHCAPNQPVPCELLEEAAELAQDACDAALSLLAGLGLLEMDDPDAGPTIHPLLAEYARTLPGAGEALSALVGTLGSLTREANETELPAPFVPLRPHVEAAAPLAEVAALGDAGILWNNLGNHLDIVAEYGEARAAFERALAIWTKTYGEEHAQVATAHNNLGNMLMGLGDLPGAREAFERALAIWTKAYGEDHPQVATAHVNLAGLQSYTGSLARARALYERALAILTRAYGESHPEVADTHNGLGLVLWRTGDAPEAFAAFERALTIWTKVYGEDHPRVADAHSNLGMLLWQQGDLARARTAFERALAISEAVYGSVHPQVANFLSNLGSALRWQGDPVGARAAFERALAIDEAVYGPDHIEVAVDLGNLGSVLVDLRDTAGARVAWERALPIFEAVLGPYHTNTRIVRGSLEDLDSLPSK